MSDRSEQNAIVEDMRAMARRLVELDGISEITISVESGFSIMIGKPPVMAPNGQSTLYPRSGESYTLTISEGPEN